MPFKSKKERAAYMRKYRKNKKQILIGIEQLDTLKKLFPSAYDLLLGKPTKKRKK